jgi:hypothetical protein
LAHRRLAHTQSRRRGGVAALLSQHTEPMQMVPEFVNLLVIHGLIVHYFEQSIQTFALVAGNRPAYTA